MATNHTENYGLNLWEPGDSFLREEFNENTAKLDETVGAIQTKLDGLFVTGTLRVAANQSCDVELGFRPRFLVLFGAYFLIVKDDFSAEQLFGEGVGPAKTSGCPLQLTDTGFSIPANAIGFEINRHLSYIAFR